MKRGILPILLMICVFCLSGCRKSEANIPELVEPVRGKQDTGLVMRGDLQRIDSYTGTMIPKVTQVYMEGSGTIENFKVWSGKKVKKDEVLIELDREAVEEELESIRDALTELVDTGAYDDRLADIDIQKKNLEYQHLAGTGADYRTLGLKKLELDEAVQNKQQAVDLRSIREESLKARQEKLEEDLENLVITAPCGGYVYIDETLSNGSFLMEGKPILKILDDTDLVFRTDKFVSDTSLNGEYYGWIEGQRVELEYIPMDTDELLALVAAGESTYTEFRLIGMEDVEAGTRGAVVTVTRKLEDVLYVPRNAVSSDGTGSFLLIGEDREKRYVTTGISTEVYTEIRSGVSEGEVYNVQ